MHHSSQGMFKNNILSKSFNLEVFKSSISILIIFFLLVVGSRFVSYFEQASEGNLDPSIIVYAVALRFPDFISLLIPLSFFIGILVTVSRLYADREIYAYFSIGLSPITLIKFILPQASFFAFATLLLSFYLAPLGKEISNDLLKIDSFEEQISSIEPGEIYNLKNSRSFITSLAKKDMHLEKVIFFNDENQYPTLISASSLNIVKKNETYDLIFSEGSLTNNLFSDDQRVVSNFLTFRTAIDELIQKEDKGLNNFFNDLSSAEDSEIQWSLSLPITIFILMIIAIYLGKIEPRKGRLSVILPGILIYVLYLSLLLLGRDYVSENSNDAFNLFYVHIIFLFIALVLFMRDKYFMFIPSEGIYSFKSISIFLAAFILIITGITK